MVSVTTYQWISVVKIKAIEYLYIKIYSSILNTIRLYLRKVLEFYSTGFFNDTDTLKVFAIFVVVICILIFREYVAKFEIFIFNLTPVGSL